MRPRDHRLCHTCVMQAKYLAPACTLPYISTQARRSLKRESKVQLSDEIIFFDDVAGNAQAKVRVCGFELGGVNCSNVRTGEKMAYGLAGLVLGPSGCCVVPWCSCLMTAFFLITSPAMPKPTHGR